MNGNQADSSRQDLHPGLKADFILANPPFNKSDWWWRKSAAGRALELGMLPVNNANAQHSATHLAEFYV